MRLAIEALGINRPGGGRVATLNLLKPLLKLDQQNEYLIYLTAPEPELAGLHPRARQRIIPIGNRFLARLYAQALLPLEIRRKRIDLIHFVKNQIVSGTGARTVATVYDLTTLRHPKVYPAVDVWYWRTVLPRQFKRMNKLIALSESTASDLVSYYRLPRDRIAVIYPGYDSAYRIAAAQEIQAARQRYGLRDDYFIHVGNFSLKKNLAMLLESFLMFRQRSGFRGKMVFVGANYPKGRDERFARMLSRDDVRDAVVHTSHVPQETLMALYSGALAFLFPSLHEGFGLAALEAMACGAPIVVHAAGAVQELVGDAGIVMQSATDTHAWSQAVERVAASPALRDRLRQAGLERAGLFTAEMTARRTLNLYRQVTTAS